MGRPDLQRESQVSPLFPSVCLSCKQKNNACSLTIRWFSYWDDFYTSRNSEGMYREW